MKYISAIYLLLSLSIGSSFAQSNSCDAVSDTLNSPSIRIGDYLLYQANYYKAHYHYNDLNTIDSLETEKNLFNKVDIAHLYYCLSSADKNFKILFYVERLDSSKFTPNMSHKNAFDFRENKSSLFYKEAFNHCYMYCILTERQPDNDWKLIKGGESFYAETDDEKVKIEFVVSLLSNEEYFFSLKTEDFWNRIRYSRLFKTKQ